MKIELFGDELEIDESMIEEPEEEIREQVKEFLGGERTTFDLSFHLPDTPRGAIWREMLGIPFGETWSYSRVAEEADSSAVAVGQACAANPLPLIIPCHRVVGEDSIGGYQAGKAVKRKLLELESQTLMT